MKILDLSRVAEGDDFFDEISDYIFGKSSDISSDHKKNSPKGFGQKWLIMVYDSE